MSTAIGLGGLAIAGLSLVLSYWSTGRSEERADARARAERRSMAVATAADTLADALTLATLIRPQAWMFNAGPRTEEIIAGWLTQWEDVRTGLNRIGVSAPDPRTRELARDCELALQVALTSSLAYGRSLPAGTSPWTVDECLELHEGYTKALNALIDALHESDVTSL